MILSQGKYPFVTIITRMRDGDVDFVISTAKEGLFKGLTTCVNLPPGNLAIKIFYMPSMTKDAIHLIHKQFVETVEENLQKNVHLAVILDSLADSLKSSPYALEVVVDLRLKEYVERLKNGEQL